MFHEMSLVSRSRRNSLFENSPSRTITPRPSPINHTDFENQYFSNAETKKNTANTRDEIIKKETNSPVVKPKIPNMDYIDDLESLTARFIDIVKQSSSYTIQLIAYKYPQHKSKIKNVYDDFYTRFNNFLTTHGRLSYRKSVSSSQTVEDLSQILENSRFSFSQQIQKEKITWNKAKPVDNFAVSSLSRISDHGVNDPNDLDDHSSNLLQKIDFSYLENVIEKLTDMNFGYQLIISNVHNLEDNRERLNHRMNTEVEIDMISSNSEISIRI